MKPSGLEYYICHDCKKGIIPPLGKPFSNGDDKIRCEACAVKYYTKRPGANIQFNGKDLMSYCKS